MRRRTKRAVPDRVRRPFRTVPSRAGPTTRLVHGGVRADLNAGAVVPPIYQTSTFRFPSEYSEAAAQGATYLYSRNGNPTVEGAEELVRLAEHGEAARLFASGMGAISAAILSLLGKGDELLLPTGLYGGTIGLVRNVLPKFGIRVRAPPEDPAADPGRLVRAGTKLVLLETPTNPVLRVHDLRAWSEAAHRAGAFLLVDNTVASPVNQNPLLEGADLVVHSATKYLGGHADLTGGALIGASELLERIDPHQTLGSPLDPFAAFLLHRSLKTLELRVARINANAQAVVEALERERSVARVHYPGRASALEEETARRQMRGRGGVVSFSLRGGTRASDRFLSRLRLFEVASSFGGVESLVSLPRQTSHRHLSVRERSERGIDPGFVRLSVGIEDAADLVGDLHQALSGAGRSG
jgi:cystathionine beta-lyase/cystathionine gamma-synthase